MLGPEATGLPLPLNVRHQKKESAPGPDGIPHGIYRCAGGSGSHFLFNAYGFVVEGGSVPTRFAASRTVVIPKSSTVDDNGLIVRSSDALRRLTLCNCDCKIITTAICFGLHRYSIRVYPPGPAMCVYQTNDGQHLRDGSDRPAACCMRNT